MKTAVAYVRVSTDDQVELSPDSQIALIKKYATDHDMILSEVFQDNGISGRTASKRPAFNKMIGLAKTKPKPFDVILVWKFSRFARNREDSIVYKSMLRKDLGIDVISISENVGDDKMSILIEAMIEAMDEFYSVNLSEEVKRGMNEKFKRGGIIAGAPYGYDVVKGELVVNQEEKSNVQYIFNEFINGTSVRSIVNWLNSKGFKTKKGNKFDNRSIMYMLSNPTYIGYLRWSTEKMSKTLYRDMSHTEIVKGNHEPIIEEDIFNHAKEIIQKNKALYPHQKKEPASYLLKGLVRCHSCGATLTKTVKGLQCHNYAKGLCSTSHYISFSKIDSIVLEYIEQSLTNTNISIENIKPKQQQNYIDYDALIKKEEIKLSRIKEAFLSGIDTIDEYKDNKAKITAVINELLDEKKANTSKEINIDDFKKKLKSSVAELKNEDLNIADKNVILRQFIKSIIFNSIDKTIHIQYYC